MDLIVSEYNKEVEINIAIKDYELEGKAVLTIVETHEPETIFHGDFWDYNLKNVSILEISVYNCKTEETETKLKEEVYLQLVEYFKEKVKEADVNFC